jgi:hypothetical protein
MLTIVLAALLPVLTRGAVGDTFTAETQEGTTLRYTVRSEEDKTCRLSGLVTDKSQLNETLTIPDEVNGYAVSSIDYTYSTPGTGGIKYGMFYGCENLRSVVLPRKMRTIGKYAFNQCVNLESITLPDSIRLISQYTFNSCTSLKEIVLPDSVSEIEGSAFSGCSGLTAVTLPAQLKVIGTYAFNGITAQAVVTALMKEPLSLSSNVFGSKFPTGITLIVPQGSKSAYRSAAVWKNFAIFEQGETIYAKTYTDEQGVVYTLQQTDTENSYSVTGYTEGMTQNVVIANDIDGCPVTAIANNAFKNCTELKSITLPNNLKSISSSAFSGCTSLTEVVSLKQNPTTITGSFGSDVYKTAILRVPVGTKEAYLNISPWSSFYIYETGEKVHDRYVTDAQGVNYTLYKKDTSFYYSLTGHTDELADSIAIPASLDDVPVTTITGKAFAGCTNLKWISLPATITIPWMSRSSVFEGCSLTLALNQEQVSGWSGSSFITALELGDNVKEVALEAFKSCQNLVKITSCEGVKVIGSEAFKNCTSLKEVHFPATLTTIGTESFYGCTALTTVRLEKGVTGIARGAFQNCTNLTDITLPEGLAKIGEYAFSGCSQLINITLPENIEICEYAFQNCTGLTEITIPKGVMLDGTWIDDFAFSGCTSITKITWNAFSFFYYLSLFPYVCELYIGKDVNNFGNGATSRCANLEIIKVDTENTVYDSREDCNAIIETATNALVSGCKSSVIPESITTIREKAFSGCKELAEVSFPAGLMRIEDEAFYGCSGLTEVCFPAGLISIGDEAFYGCLGLQSVISYIKTPWEISAFSSQTLSSATLTIPFGKTKAYRNTNGWGFKTIVEMEGNEEETTFIQFADATTKRICVQYWDDNEDGEVSIYEAKQVTFINHGWFNGSAIVSFDELKYFTNLTTIMSGAFQNCENMTSITLPESVNSIERYAFEACKNLVSVNIPKGVAAIKEYTFSGCSSLSSVNIPNGVTTIGERAFEGCSNLTTITLPEGLTAIGTYAFSKCGLSEMTLPSTLTTIGDYGLAGNVIRCLFATPIDVNKPIADAYNVFLYVPQGSEKAFSEANGWKDFIIMGLGGEDTTIDWTEGQITVDVEEAGQLRLAVLELDEEEITRLKIRGKMNSVDIVYLRESVGKIAHLESLDLSDVTLVYDGGCYKSGGSGASVLGAGSNYYYYLSEEDKEVKVHSYLGGGPYGIDYYYSYSPYLAGAFAGLPYKHVVMPRSITKAARYVFSGCSDLQSFEFPGGFNVIQTGAFSGCIRLTTFDFEQVDSVYAYAFENCKMLQHVEHLEHISYVGGSAFEDCVRLGTDGTLSLPNVETIPERAFYNCYGIKAVKFPDRLQSIGNSAFGYCKNLLSIDLPESLTKIDDFAFYECRTLRQVNYPESLLHVNYESFLKTPWLETLPSENGIKYMGNIALCYDKQTADASSTAIAFREGTTCIADRFIESVDYNVANNITQITFPSSLIRIGVSAFSGGELPITSLTLPEQLRYIGERAFYGAQKLTKVTLSENLEEFGEGCFGYCQGLTIVNYNTRQVAGSNLFAGCTNLEKANIGPEVRLLPNGIFNGCTKLTVAKFAERNDDTPLILGDSVFYGCAHLESLSLPTACVEEIGSAAFSGCAWLIKFVVPQKVTTIHANTFNGCSSLMSVKLHDGVKTIGDDAFSGCSILPSIELPVGIDSIGSGAFSGCHSFTELTIPASVTRLGSNFVADCYQLTLLNSRIARPDNIDGVIPMSKKVLADYYGFSQWDNDPKLTDWHYQFVTLIVPDGSKELYRKAEGWKKFNNIQEVSGNDLTATNKLSVDHTYVNAGQTTDLNVSLTNSVTDFTAYQFDLIMPLGLSIATDSQGKLAVKKGSRYADESVMLTAEQLPVHLYADFVKYRIVCMSATNTPITGNEGLLLTITLRASENKPLGDYDATLENIIFTRTDGTNVELDYVPFMVTIENEEDGLKGDVNRDEEVDVADVVQTVNYTLGKTPQMFAKYNADVNGDGEVNVGDIVAMIGIITGTYGHVAESRGSNMLPEHHLTGIKTNPALTIGAGEKAVLNIKLPNTITAPTAWQMALTLPDGIEVAKREDGTLDCQLSSRHDTESHTLTVADQGNGRYIMVCYSAKNIPLTGQTEDIVSLTLHATENAECKSFEGSITDVVVSDSEGIKTLLAGDRFELQIEPSGISCIMANGHTFDVYTLGGRKVRHQVTNVDGLPKGVYIVEGQKVVVK